MALALRDIDDDLAVAFFVDDLKALSVIGGHEGLPDRSQIIASERETGVLLYIGDEDCGCAVYKVAPHEDSMVLTHSQRLTRHDGYCMTRNPTQPQEEVWVPR